MFFCYFSVTEERTETQRGEENCNKWEKEDFYLGYLAPTSVRYYLPILLVLVIIVGINPQPSPLLHPILQLLSTLLGLHVIPDLTCLCFILG